MEKSVWDRVTGPATALVATLRRLAWSWTGDLQVQDGIGNTFVFGLDAPSQHLYHGGAGFGP